MEPVAEFVVDFANNFFAGFSEIVVTNGRFVDENERSFTTNANAVDELAFEASFFNEPSGVEFIAIRTATDRVTFVFGDFSLLII